MQYSTDKYEFYTSYRYSHGSVDSVLPEGKGWFFVQMSAGQEGVFILWARKKKA